MVIWLFILSISSCLSFVTLGFKTLVQFQVKLCKVAHVCLVAQLCLTLCDPVEVSLPSSSVHGGISPGKNAGVGCHALLQGIFPTQGSNPGLPHCRWIFYCLSHQGSPKLLTVCPYYPFNDDKIYSFIPSISGLCLHLFISIIISRVL